MGIRPAQRPKNNVMSSSVTACVMPATGVRPPFFTLVAVRAIAPVAGIPPNRGDAMLATPWATSSMLERWRPPIIPSATTAESSDSTAPSRAMVNAAPMSPGICRKVTAGRDGAGSTALITPNRLAMVSTGKCPSCTAAVVAMSATNGLGMRWLTRGHRTMMATVTPATPTAQGLSEAKCAANVRQRITNSAGTGPIFSPRKSFTSPDRMIRAIPLVKPMVTG